MRWTGENRSGSVVQPEPRAGQAEPRPTAEPQPAPDAELQRAAAPLIVVLGPTAAGKTPLAILLAQAVDGEIVSADSRQIYKYMDIGTAKPSAQERAAVPHHLLDMISPAETFSLAQYQRAAFQAIDDIQGRDRVPLLVGGTGQYITAVIEGWGIPEVPPNAELREKLEGIARDQGARALHSRLQEVDPEAAQRIDYRNVRRVVRALEVYFETGMPISVLQHKTPPPYRILQIGLTMPRDDLYARVDARIDRMVADGLLDEVRALLHAGYTWACPAMSGLGYAQWRPYLAGQSSLPETIAAIRRDTRAFVRRQYTWFNGHDSGIHWLDMSQLTSDAALDLAASWLAHRGE